MNVLGIAEDASSSKHASLMYVVNSVLHQGCLPDSRQADHSCEAGILVRHDLVDELKHVSLPANEGRNLWW